MDKTALNAHLVTTRLKRCFYHLKSAVDQMCGKVLVRLPMKGMISFILLLVGHVFRGDKFLVVFRQVRDWHRKVRGARVGMVCMAVAGLEVCGAGVGKISLTPAGRV